MAVARLHQDVDYLALVRDLTARSMNIVQGRGATVCAVLRPEPNRVWVGLTPHNQLAWRYGLQLPWPTAHGERLFSDEMVGILRRAESLRRHHRSRFDALATVGWLHGAPVRESTSFLDDPPLAMYQDALRTALLTAVGEPAPLLDQRQCRLAGFSWFDGRWQDDYPGTGWARLYLTSPALDDVVGIEVDIPASTPVLPDLMVRMAGGIPADWYAYAHDGDAFCQTLLDLRSHPQSHPHHGPRPS